MLAIGNTDMFMTPVWNDFSFITWCIDLLQSKDAVIKMMNMISNYAQVSCGI